jgi:uncharacterized protein (DUF58 family)
MLEARAFEPEFLRKLDRLVLGIRRARTVRSGQRSLGRVQGLGLEVENFKDYAEGDDLRFLDWNAMARLDDLLIRTYRVERQVEVSALVDASASMAFPERDDKLGFALALGAALVYIAMSNNDASRLGVFSARRGRMVLAVTPFRRRRESYLDFKPFVTGVRAGGETRLGAAVDEFLRERRPAGVVIVISDFLISQTDSEDALARLVNARHEVKVVHLLGDIEAAGAYPRGLYRIRDAETREMREAVFGPDAAESCRRKIAALAERLSQFCARRGIVYAQAFGASNLDAVLARELPRLGIIK